MDFDKLLDDAELPEARVPICLKGKLRARFEEIDDQLVKLMEQREQQGSGSLAGDGAAELREQLEQIEAEMKEHTYPFRLRAMGRSRWRKMMDAHPPRAAEDGVVSQEVAARDAMAGVNRDTFMEPMLRISIIDPVITDEQWSVLNDKLTDRQYEDLVNAAWEINQGKVDIPFSRAALLSRRTTGEELRQQNGLV